MTVTDEHNIFKSLKMFHTITFIQGLTDKKLINSKTKYQNFLVIFILNVLFFIMTLKFNNEFYEESIRAIYVLLEKINLNLVVVIFLISNVQKRDKLLEIFQEIKKIDRKLQLNVLSKKLMYKLNKGWLVCFAVVLFFIIGIKNISENFIFYAFDLESVASIFIYGASVSSTYLLLKVQMFVYLIMLNKRAQVLHEGKFNVILRKIFKF